MRPSAFLIFSFMMTTLFFFNPFSAFSQEPIATFKHLSGEVFVERNQKEIIPDTGHHLYREDVICTGSDGSAGIIFQDGTCMGLGPSSTLRMDSYAFEPLDKKYAFDAYMKQGSAVYSTGKLGKLAPEAVSIRTPRATIGIRGTKFLIQVE